MSVESSSRENIARTSAGTVELAALDVNLDRRLQQAEQEAAGVDLVLGELLDHLQRLVPASEHEQRVGRSASTAHSHAVGLPTLPGQRECLVQVAEGLGVLVAMEARSERHEVRDCPPPRRDSWSRASSRECFWSAACLLGSGLGWRRPPPSRVSASARAAGYACASAMSSASSARSAARSRSPVNQ